MSTGVKKPPLAPKPKIVRPQKPGPPPIAPKPDVSLSCPSPAALKRAKPALAPKPCLPKAPPCPDPKAVPSKGGPQTCARERRGSSDKLGALNSRNGLQTDLGEPDSDYIIPTCGCGRRGCPQCRREDGRETTRIVIAPLESLQNGGPDGSGTRVSPVPRVRTKTEIARDNTGSGKSQVVNTSFLEQKLKDVWVQAVSANNCHLKHRPREKTPVQNGKAGTTNQNLNPVQNSSGSGRMPPEGSQNDDDVESLAGPGDGQLEDVSESIEASVDAPEECGEEGRHPGGPRPAPQVPAAPRKPLPVPPLRKPRKPGLVRQDGTEELREEAEQAEEKVRGLSVVRNSPFLSPKVFVHTESVTYARSPSANQEHSSASRGLDMEEDSAVPIPPPRQTSLTSTPHKHLDLSYMGRSREEEEEEEEGEEFSQVTRATSETINSAEDEEGEGPGFAHYPTRSLPKQIKLNCNLPLSVATKAASVEERSPKVAPKKPQRHSLPASGQLRKEPSEEVPERSAEAGGGRGPSPTWEEEDQRPCSDERGSAVTESESPTRELPPPPVEKALWRTIVPFFGRQASRISIASDTQGKSPGPKPGKPRAKSFSAADLVRVDGPKRSSFRKLLELKLSVKMLPKLLAKGGQSLDCTTGEREQSVDGELIPDERPDPLANGRCVSPGSASAGRRKMSCPLIGLEQSVDDDDDDESGPGVESAVEYENLPFYEEIPEYMNLPLLNATHLGWHNSSSIEDGEDIYEVQEPYEFHKTDSHEEDQSAGNGGVIDSSEEEEGEEEDDASSASSKGEPEPSGDRQDEIQAKKNKVVHIAKEIMSSEKVFVDVLKLLHIDFRDAVAKASRQSGKPVIEERILNQILYYLPQLYELNRDLLRELEERVAHWDDQQCLADIFVKKGPYLKMYSTYIREFDHNVALLDEQCRKNPGFAAAVRDFEMSPRCASLALKHYLLKPVQRIPQYQLLLTDYLKKLPEESSDYKDTQAALSIVKEVANHANDIMKQGDNFQKLMQIQYSLNGHHEIVQPGRVFLKEGTLRKLSRKVMQPRMFFLFNDALLYTTPVQSGQFKLNSMLSLAGMKVSKPSQEAYQNELNIESVERSFILSASSATEREAWLEAISRAIDDHTRKKITFISSKSQEEVGGVCLDSGAPLGSKAPIWIPDLRATMCMICTCEFTLTWRRHHCRACGKVVCQACSTHKHYLEYLKNQPARVCDHCFPKLQRKSDLLESSPGGKFVSGSFSSVLSQTRKQKKIPAALKEVTANTENSSMSGYLLRSKGTKKQWKKLWFVIKNKVLYTYAASEDVAALESQPLLGFFLREEKSGEAQKLQFKLYHKNTLFYIFKAEDVQTAQRWIDTFQEAMVL
ncbi:FYVE, RhoGEF and PH domain-containing protein 6-like [Conger conger]|uniref:FYVE, RhoGEF and PH domain-containing protein 6-like n=1 Tax=Conger conger TaxID=82655 RepID=UPI002A59C489|nr:FYVE, RhoGEF and PH domain-containing protein 6-like [Conger conger]